jgi:hypothetical protein
MKAITVGLAAAVIGLGSLVPAAAAKDFKPGDLRVCAKDRCRAIKNQRVLDLLSAFYYGSVKPTHARWPRRRAPYLELRFRNGYVTGVAAGRRFDRFLSFGVNLDQFAARTWYAIPARAALEIERSAASPRPRPLPADVLDRSH